jgi:hypothetical protein
VKYNILFVNGNNKVTKIKKFIYIRTGLNAPDGIPDPERDEPDEPEFRD